jgi:flagellar biosynthesis protein FlhA
MMNWRKLIQSYSGIPLMVMAILSMVILPLPAWLLDALFTFNIVLSLLVLLVSVSAKRPLDFSVFPTVLLIATLMRLSLNIASTRVVLLHGQNGPDAAGKVIKAFGEVVIGGNYVVGFVVFIILMIINFVVITKGGERISEVSARFTLDAMPGKQMAIDADLNAGLIDQKQAKKRRQEVASEADFYGAMDGASKFVRGDAIAGMLILIINMVGGLCIGIFQHGLGLSEAFQIYSLLTIGDGLVAQIPSLLMSTAAAIIVTRINDDGEMSDLVRHQLLASPRVMWTAALLMAVMGLVPGMPTLAFLSFAAVLAYSGWRTHQQQELQQTSLEQAEDLGDKIKLSARDTLEWQDLPYPDAITVEIGYRLVSMADPAKNPELLTRLKGIRKTLAEQLGFLLPEIRVRDNLHLKPEQYQIKLTGTAVTSGKVEIDRLMAINSGDVYGKIDGILVKEPAYGMDAVWIAASDRPKALNMGYSVVEPASVIATHVGKIIRENLEELFGLDEVFAWHQRLTEVAPKLSEALNLALTPIQQLRTLRYLLREQISLSDIKTIAVTLLDSCEITKDPILLSADIRCALKRGIIKQIAGEKTKINIFTLDDKLEKTLMQALQQAQQQGKVALDSFPVEPNLLSQLQQKMPVIKEKMHSMNNPPVLVVAPQLRPLLARYARGFSKGLKVLSYNEIPEYLQIDIIGTLG